MIAVLLVCVGCSSSTTPSPVQEPVVIEFSALTGTTTVFDDLIEKGFHLTARNSWYNMGAFGLPAPAIWHFRFKGLPSIPGDVTITRTDGSSFTFSSVDLGPSQPAPWVFTGTRAGQTVFTEQGTVLVNLLGAVFQTVQSTHSADLIDSLTIKVTTTEAACCETYTYLDNVRLVKR